MFTDNPNFPEVVVNSEQFGTDGVLVILDWILDNTSVNISVNINSVPTTDVTINVTSTQLTIPYNTPTNVSIAATLCGMYNTTVTIIGLNYGEWFGSKI